MYRKTVIQPVVKRRKVEIAKQRNSEYIKKSKENYKKIMDIQRFSFQISQAQKLTVTDIRTT